MRSKRLSWKSSKGPTVGRAKGRGEASSQAGNWKGKNMAEKMRYNKIIDLLEHGKPVFSTSTVPNGSLDDLTYIEVDPDCETAGAAS